MDVRERIESVEKRISAACARSGRKREDVKVVAVTKYVSLQLTEQIVEAGFVHVGENRWQNAKDKWEALSDRAVWHFIGQLQTNKVKDVVGKFPYIHSVDRLSLAKEISRKAVELGVVVRIFLQVNVSGEDTKSGVAPEGLRELADSVKNLPGLQVEGLMTMAPNEEDPERTRPVFRRLRELRDELNAAKLFSYPLKELSMGMSGDFEIAIEEGATWVRLGSVLLPNEG